MNCRRRDAPGLRSRFIRLALLLALAWAAQGRDPPAPADFEDASAKSSSGLPLAEGPERLKQQAHVTVETNVFPAAAGTNGPAPKPKAFQFRYSWAGWNGLHLELASRTLLPDPLGSVRDRVEDTNAFQVFHLEELKMSGTIGGRLDLDAATYLTGNQFQDFEPGAEVRRARVYSRGDCLLLLPVSYEVEISYIPHELTLENSYLSFKGLPWIGELKFGQFQPPMGLDLVTSSRDISFMEPASPLEALAPGISAGVQVGQPALDDRATWRFGVFTDGLGKDYGDASRDYGRAILRFSGLPLWTPPEAGATRLLHLGLSANVLYSSSSSVRYRSRPESRLAPYVVDTGDLSAEGALATGLEAAWVNGPFSLQGELLRSWVRENNGQLPQFYGFYASASWFITGETRPYNRREGYFDRAIPKRNLDFCHGGWGAWELTGRYSLTDLDNSDIEGGRVAMLMAGVNWYLHSHLKWRFEYGFGRVTHREPEGCLNVFQTRVQVDF